jgi:SIR2-like domain
VRGCSSCGPRSTPQRPARSGTASWCACSTRPRPAGPCAFVDQARRLPRSGPAGRRRVPLLAVPVIGTGDGGGATVKGEAVARLLQLLAEVARDVDIALVVTTDAMAAAAREQRRRPEQRRAFESELGVALVAEADRLAGRARRGEIVLFTGAGTGVPAGLPTWDGLLRDLAGGELFTEPELRELSALDKAAIIERRIGRPALLEAIATAVSVDAYALGHALLGNLPVTESATLNYDELLETAALDAGRRLAVLPYERPGHGYDGWLLKLHGCVRPDRRADIVLTRADYLAVGQHRAALTGLLQAMLVTRHMLFVGFGLGDEHFHAVVHDVRRALLPPTDAGKDAFGTALVLRPQRAAEMVWADDLTLLSMDGEDPARRLEVFLDRLANEADQGWQHVLDDGFRSILTDGELTLRGLLEQLVAAREPLDAGGAWPAVEVMLRRFGWNG